MTVHYHGTPITPISVLQELAGRNFCVSFARPDDVKRCHRIGQSVMLDNGAFSLWKKNKQTNWPGYYEFCEKWLAYPTTWAVIPDRIDAPAELQDELIRQWPFGDAGSPVWHLNEPVSRFLRLCSSWPKVCIGSTSEYSEVLSDPWKRRMDEAFDALAEQCRQTYLPWVHMLRGMACVGERWPFASVDSTDIARNHNRPQNMARMMADAWDAVQCPATWKEHET